MRYVPSKAGLEQELAFSVTKPIAVTVTPESGLVPEVTMMIPTRAETKHGEVITVIST